MAWEAEDGVAPAGEEQAAGECSAKEAKEDESGVQTLTPSHSRPSFRGVRRAEARMEQGGQEQRTAVVSTHSPSAQAAPSGGTGLTTQIASWPSLHTQHATCHSST